MVGTMAWLKFLMLLKTTALFLSVQILIACSSFNFKQDLIAKLLLTQELSFEAQEVTPEDC